MVYHGILKTQVAKGEPKVERAADWEIAEMTHGKNVKTNLNSRTKNQGDPLPGFSEPAKKTLEEQMADLAERIAYLEERVDRLDGVIPSHFLLGAKETEKAKPGPDKNIDDDELFRSRDSLVGWLEGIWPEIVQSLYAATDPRQVAAILKSVASPKARQPLWQSRFLRHPARLLNFLNSEKFKKKPPRKTVLDALNLRLEDEKRKRAANRLPTRQIANAMAGVPKVRWRTSLDRCSKNPCQNLVTIGTAEHYRAMYAIPPRNI